MLRRKDREITDFDEMMKIIAKCDTCRVAMFDETFPYIVPLNFGTDLEDDQLYLYFHGAKIGKKIDLMRKNKNVSFEMDCEHNIILYDERYAILVREEFSCLEFIMNRDTINWILKKLNTGGRTWSIYQRKSIKTVSATRWWENTTSPT